MLYICCFCNSEHDLSCDEQHHHGEIIRIKRAVHVAVAVAQTVFRNVYLSAAIRIAADEAALCKEIPRCAVG